MRPVSDTSAFDVDSPTASIIEHFEQRVEEEPGREAIHGWLGQASVSFGELDSWANGVAAHLIATGGTSEEVIVLAITAPALMLAAAIGVLKAGKTYSALNPSHPVAQVDHVLDELKPAALLYDSGGQGVRRAGDSAYAVEEVVTSMATQTRPRLAVDADRVAYVLYTSGSTGRPRGFGHSRRDMLHNVARHAPLSIEAEDRVTLISFDGFVSAVSNPFVALLGGASLAPYSFRDSGVESALEWMTDTGVTVMYAFPTFLRQLAAAEPADGHGGLRLAYLGGESVLSADLRAARRLFPTATLATGLNSTETGLTCLYTLDPGDVIPDRVPLGTPVLDVEVEVTDDDGLVLAPGAPGRIVISSQYINPRSDTSRSADMAQPFRTGDRGLIGADGLAYHLGRMDGMVKVRGFRVEPTEVEAAISSLPSVSEVAVFGVRDGSADATLVAYVVARDSGLDGPAVRAAVAERLPLAMVPGCVVISDALPQTANGKLDRERLRVLARAESSPEKTPSAVPEEQASTVDAAVDRRLAELWCSELGLEDVDGEDDFFALGGTSIDAVALVSRIRRELGIQLPLATLFESPTLRAFGIAVTSMESSDRGTTGVQRHGIEVRLVREDDLSDVCKIVNHYIAQTTWNFRLEPQTESDWLADWSANCARYPWLVASVDDTVAGVAYAGPWKLRAAYDWSAEVTVYVAEDLQHLGVGRALYSRLLPMLDQLGFRTAVAVIALPNPGSVALHEAYGFNHVGTLPEIGFKHGKWVDVGFWHRRGELRSAAPEPTAGIAPE